MCYSWTHLGYVPTINTENRCLIFNFPGASTFHSIILLHYKSLKYNVL